jgi:N-acetylglucosaminyldiphosphoundecaprenol N-acetyl-beta-D-mannosaminyltransferase
MDTPEAVTPIENEYPEVVKILDVRVHNVTTEETLDLVCQFMSEPGLHQIATVNPEFVMTAQDEEAFRQVLNRVDLCIPDGIGLLMASRWLRKPLRERVAGSDLVYHLAAQCADRGWKLFLLGAAPGIAEQAAAIFQDNYPGITIAGTYPGSPAVEENDALVQRINESGAEILFVAYGAPAQDLWISRNSELLEHVRLAMGVGGSLDFITGQASRAPEWVQRIHLEWFYRLIREPWRWRRMLALPKFAFLVLFSRGR